MPPLETAIQYVKRGWKVIPVPSGSKNPGFGGWQTLRLSEQDLSGRFNGQPLNIGVLLGEPSGWLIDIDLDHPRAVELAPQFLPPTDAIFGRPSKPRSHWIYRVTSPVATKKHTSKSAGMIVELRSTGMQTIFPPSIHESGEEISWEIDGAEPATVDSDQLIAAVKQLADAVKIELGERQRPSEKRSTAKPVAVTNPLEATSSDPMSHAESCLAALLRIGIVDQRDGSHRLFVAACRAVEFDLDDATALTAIREYARQRPFARSWADSDITRRLRDAEKQCVRGQAFKSEQDGCIELGGHDPESGRLILSPKRTLPTAKSYVRDFHLHPNGRTIHSYAGLVMGWRGNCYREIEELAVKHRLHGWLHDAMRYSYNPRSGESTLVNFDANPTTVNAALDTIKSYAHLPATITAPSWLGSDQGRPHAREILPCNSCLLHLPTMQRLEQTPFFFNTNALDFDPDPNAGLPTQWLAFLDQIFRGDTQSLELLQDWFGYCLTGDTSQQKMLLTVGPKRSGKGTIGRVLSRLIGSENVAGPTTSSLAGPFGLQPLIGKTLAIVSDARFHGDNIQTVVERLLCISGEDALTIDRKHLVSVTMKLPTRFMFLTNEFPRLSDASGALAGRLIVLRLTESFFGMEDTGLTARLLLELPGILNWAIDGWQRLRQRGHFVLPQSVQDAVQEIEDLSSPVAAFVRDQCVVEPGRRVAVDDLYGAWKGWCDGEGRNWVGTKQTFGRDLAAAVASVVRRRGTEMQPFYDGIGLRGHQIW